MAADVLLKNGMVMDGTGERAVRADVLVRDDRVEDVGVFPDADARSVLDVEGLTVAPGFIDCHTHVDFFLPSPRHAQVMERWARQGVTTIVSGNCGWSPAPIRHGSEDTVSTYWNFALPHDGLDYAWTTMAEYFDCLERNGQAYNVAILTGHNVLRINEMGFESRFARDSEVSRMKTALKQSLEAGSIGLSLGLFYCPGFFAHTDEITELASVLTEFGAPLVTHTRGLTEIFDKAVEEVIHVAETNKIPLHISHNAGGGRDPKVRVRAYQAIEEARGRGVEIGHDNMPWACGPTTLLALLPPWLYVGGFDQFFERLRDRDVRKRVVEEVQTKVPVWPNWDHDWWTDNFFTRSAYLSGFRLEKNRRFENRSIRQIAEELDKDPYDTVFDLILEERGKLFCIAGRFDDPQADDAMASLISDPNCAIMTDTVGADFETMNPVSYGAFTKVLGRFARDKGLMTQEEAVRKMTSLPAKQMGLVDRGCLRKGAYADITVFNAATVINRATFSDPRQFSEGIEYVFINGRPVLERGAYHADALAGRVLRRT